MVSAVLHSREFSPKWQGAAIAYEIVLAISGLLTNLYFILPFLAVVIVIIYMTNRYLKTPEAKKIG